MDRKKTSLSKEIELVPWWAYVLAAAAVVGIEVMLYIGLRQKPHPPPPGLRIFIQIMLGVVLTFLVLLVGYVNRDAKRRRMNRTLWTLLVIFVPNAIGFILYFVLRRPLSIQCPQCGTFGDPAFNFCPKCKCNLRPTCPACQRGVDPEDRYCPYCSRELPAGRTPAEA